MPANTVEGLLKPENKANLAAIRTYHLVSGKVISKDIAGKTIQAPPVQSQKLSIDATKGVQVDDTQVVKADMETSNGVIDVVAAVFLPKS